MRSMSAPMIRTCMRKSDGGRFISSSCSTLNRCSRIAVTAIRSDRLAAADLYRYEVLILPAIGDEAGYLPTLGEAGVAVPLSVLTPHGVNEVTVATADSRSPVSASIRKE